MISMIAIGHRGAAGYCLENTKSSVIKALELGVDYVEIDVHRTSDNHLIVFHDALLDRLTNKKGYISDFSLSELKSTVKLANGDTIPTLQEICELVNDHGRLFVEIKVRGIEKQVVDIVSKYFNFNSFVIASFCHETIVNVKNLNPSIITVALFEGIPINLKTFIKSTKADFLGMGIDSIDEIAINQLKKNGAKVIVWTVDNIKEIKRLQKFKVDGIISNFPDRIR